MEDVKKETKQFDNSMYKERFQFVLSVNDNIICQRYFKINGFNRDSLNSVEFRNGLRYCVDELIKNDLVSKSRVYIWYTNSERPIKMTGFVTDKELDAYRKDDPEAYAIRWFLSDLHKDTYEKEELPNGNLYSQSFVSGGKEYIKQFFEPFRPEMEEEEVVDENATFKFSFLIDENVVYEQEWDGMQYPRYVRNSVDLTNSDASYRDKDPKTLYFSLAIIRHLTVDRNDLTFQIIKTIQEICSSSFTLPAVQERLKSLNIVTKEKPDGRYTMKEVYANADSDKGNKVYHCSPYPYGYVNAWRKAVEDKTRQYENWVNSNFSPRYLEYIDRNY